MPNETLGYGKRDYTNVAGWLIVPQILVAGFALVNVWFLGMHSVGCSTHCDYATAYAASVTLVWVVVGIAALTLAALIVWRRRGWKTWPIALGGVVLTILAAVVADQVIAAAFA